VSYSEKIAKVLADQLARFVTLNTHQLAGYVATLDFWISEVGHTLNVINGYEQRFRQLKIAQDRYVDKHGTQTYLLEDPHIVGRPEPPRRVPHTSLRDARCSVTEATYRLLVRCCNEGLIPEAQMRTICASLDIGVESRDIC
jgi:hypothetical protein